MAGKAIYFQRGETLDYLNETDEIIEAGTIIDLKTRIGVAGCDILPGEMGSLHVTGVFEIEKTDTAAIEQGAEIGFDGTGAVVGSGTPAGYAAKKSTETDKTVFVKLLG